MTVSQQQLLAEVCRLSGTTVFQYVEGNRYVLCGQLPEWMTTWDSDSSSQTSTGHKDAEKQWILNDHFTQLLSMQEDLDAFWRKRGYAPLPGVVAHFAWKDLYQPEESDKPLQFWMRALDQPTSF